MKVVAQAALAMSAGFPPKENETPTDWASRVGMYALALLRVLDQDPHEELNIPWMMREWGEALRVFNTGKGAAVLSGLRCWAWGDDGQICGAPVVGVDVNRGLVVCEKHLPAESGRYRVEG